MKKIAKFVFSAFTASILVIMVTACGSSSDSTAGIELKVGETLRFGGNEAGGIENGWSTGDGLRTWSDGYLSVLKFDVANDFPSGVNMLISMGSFVNNKNPKMNVTIKANGVIVKKLDFSEALSGGDISLNIPTDILKNNANQLVLSFDLPDAAVPHDIGWNDDVRRLGIWITEIKIREM